FVANVSHELRTPLTLLLAPIDTALKSGQLTNKNFTLLSLAKSNGINLQYLVNDLLDLNKLEKAKLELHEKPVNFYNTLRRIVSGFESYSDVKDLHFEFHYFPDKYLNLQLDTKKFEKIVNNLLSNAFKFTADNGRILLETSETPSEIQIKVQDTGRGIHREDLPNVFNRFYQTKRKDATAEGGTGIGLALSNELAKLMKGKLRVESELNKGSTFYFTFPKKEVIGMLKEASEKMPDTPGIHDEQSSLVNEPTTPQAVKSATILLVEDNKNMRDYIQLILLDKYNIITAENGKEALNLLSTINNGNGSPSIKNCDLIISDMMMPEMDGLQLIQHLKNDIRYSAIPSIMLTARAEMKDKLTALRLGVDDYITKPFEQEELFARVENLLHNAGERKKWLSEVEPELEEELIEDPLLSKEATQWLESIEEQVNKELSQFEFNTQALADQMNISRSQLFRRLKKLTGLTPSQYIKEARLNQARILLENQTYSSVKSVAFSVGIKHLGKFSQYYKERFGKSPSAYLGRLN
ncbi:MAG: response regulator, partial [Bacteroidetes bacterium]|nr:response regulator [Bacteroidota bacterium]